MTKPRLLPEDQRAYDLVAALQRGAAVVFEGKPATFTGMAGYLVTLRANRRSVYLRAGDQAIREIAAGIHD